MHVNSVSLRVKVSVEARANASYTNALVLDCFVRKKKKKVFSCNL